MGYTKECSDVYFILNNLDKDSKRKIPNELFDFLNFERDKEYISSINLSVPIDKQNLNKGTVELLSEIYQKFLCSNEEKIEFIREKSCLIGFQDNQNILNDIFEKETNEKKEMVLVKIEEKNLLRKILNKIKKMINKRPEF